MSEPSGSAVALAGDGLSGSFNSTHIRSRICLSCGRGIDWDALSCPYCQWSTAGVAGRVADAEPISSGTRALLYAVSLLVPLLGVILGATHITKKSEAHTSVGIICLVLGLVNLFIVMPVLLSLILYLMVIGI